MAEVLTVEAQLQKHYQERTNLAGMLQKCREHIRSVKGSMEECDNSLIDLYCCIDFLKSDKAPVVSIQQYAEFQRVLRELSCTKSKYENDLSKALIDEAGIQILANSIENMIKDLEKERDKCGKLLVFRGTNDTDRNNTED